MSFISSPTSPVIKKRRFISFVSLLLILSGSIILTLVNTTISRAAIVTWDGGGTDGTCGGNVGDGNKWSCAANWTNNAVPTSADTVRFDATSAKDATVDASFPGSITSLTIDANYTGTVTLARSLQTTGAFTQAGGTFTASNQTLDVNGVFTLSNGSFTASSDIMTFASTFTVSGSPTFNANGGIVAFDGSSATLTCNNITFNLVTIVSLSSSTKTIGSTCNLPLGANPSIRPITLNGTLSGSGTLTITNTNNVAFNAGANLVGFSGLVRGGNFIISGATLDLSDYTTVDIDGSFIINSGTFTAPSNEMFVGSSLQFTGGTFNANSGTVTFDTSSNSYIDCRGAPFNLVAFSNDSQGYKTVYDGCTLPLGNNPDVTAGTLTNQGTLTGTGILTTNNLRLDTTSVLSGFNGVIVNDTFNNNGATTNLSSYTTADFNDSFTLTSGTFTAPRITMTVAGDFAHTGGIFNHNNATVTVDGTNQTLSGSSTFYNLTKTTSSTDTLTFTNGTTQTITNTLTLQGAANHLLSIVSDTPGQQWNIDPQGTRTLNYLNVRDSHNTNAIAITVGSTVTDLGNNTGWTFSAPPSSNDDNSSTGTTGTATASPSSSLTPTPVTTVSTAPGLRSTLSPSAELPAPTPVIPPVDSTQTVPSVVIRTIGSNGQSITGAKVSLYSTPRSTISDDNGIAVFENIEAGEHQLIVAYRDKIAIQRLKISESGAVTMLNAHASNVSTTENELTISLEDSSPLVPVIVLILSRIAAGVLALLVYLVYVDRRRDLDYLGLLTPNHGANV